MNFKRFKIHDSTVLFICGSLFISSAALQSLLLIIESTFLNWATLASSLVLGISCLVKGRVQRRIEKRGGTRTFNTIKQHIALIVMNRIMLLNAFTPNSDIGKDAAMMLYVEPEGTLNKGLIELIPQEQHELLETAQFWSNLLHIWQHHQGLITRKMATQAIQKTTLDMHARTSIQDETTIH